MRKIAFLFLLLIFASSCTVESGRESIISDSECQLPCWNNITPGQTNRDQLIRIVADLEAVDQKSVIKNSSSSSTHDEVVFFNMYLNSRVSGVADFRGQASLLRGVVTTLILCGKLGMTIDEVTQIIGDPEYIITNGNLAGGRDVILLNPQKGIYYWYLTNLLPENMRQEITKSIEIYCLSMFDLNMYDQMLEAGEFSMGHYNKEETLTVMYQWIGYGNLDQNYPSRQP